jgi:fermentation-respiration switch protein FrsA (DUF1100 family)
MRRVHFAAEKRLGRMLARRFLRTRISPHGWPVTPLAPADAASMVAPVPLLVVQGDCDPYFPSDHGRELYDAARDPREFWLLPGFGHAELATDDALADRFAAWVMAAVAVPGPAASLGGLRTISAGEASMSGSRASTGPLPTLDGRSA